MDDDFSTAKVLANLFELAPIINSIKDKIIAASAVSSSSIERMQQKFKLFLEDIFGLKNETATDNKSLDGVMQLLIDIRNEAKSKKDYATSDKIRNQLAALGITMKDEKGGGVSWSVQ
jgi:cysteinyl-tRNA synthetase